MTGAMPRATYRVQLRDEFAFADAAAVVPYLAALGVSHLYCSPYLQAARGSTHGYDVVDPTRVSADLGGDAGLGALSDTLCAHGMSQLLDIVPNHMCVTDPRNRMWWDVLRHGRRSEHAHVFDIDWDAPGCDGRLVLPVLGDDLDTVLARGELTLGVCEGEPVLRYYEQTFPVRDVPAGTTAPSRALLDRQPYSLEHWRTGLRHINYRRFFDIASLAGVCQEHDAVFALTHERVRRLVADGVVAGLRVDHIDGLRDPAAYATRLRALAPGAWLVVEKILAAGEVLPPAWPVDGTTGYDAAALLTSLHIQRRGLDELVRCYMEFVDDAGGVKEHARAARRLVLQTLLTSEVDRLTRIAASAGIADAATSLIEMLAAMPVYRVYPQEWEPLDAEGTAAVRAAADAALDAGRAGPRAVEALVDVLLGNGDDTPPRRDLRARFQQLSAAAIAKGMEDTTLYRFIPCVALNEVGSEPLLTTDAGEFHAACAALVSRSPRALVATATHDTKRGEDARLRVAMLSEMPERWTEAVRRLRVRAGSHRGERAPSPTAEYLLYQTLVAAHPIDAERLTAYMRKAAREAKVETSWLDPDEAYEAELDRFVRAVLDDPVMLGEIESLLAAMTPAWQVAALSQVLLKCTMPGVPDVYQGCELWDLRLVDPDNRGPVEYEARRTMLAECERMDAGDVMAAMDAGMPKLHVLHTALQMRAEHASCFDAGAAYTALRAEGPLAAHVVAFTRDAAEDTVITVAVREALAARQWRGTTVLLPDGAWRNVLTGDTVPGGRQDMHTLTARFPVGLLERAG